MDRESEDSFERLRADGIDDSLAVFGRPPLEKIAQQRTALGRQHAAEYIDAMIHTGELEHIQQTACPARLGVESAEHHAAYARVHQCRRAHHARLERDIQRGVVEPVAAEGAAPGAQRLDLGVRGRIAGASSSARSM